MHHTVGEIKGVIMLNEDVKTLQHVGYLVLCGLAVMAALIVVATTIT